MTKKQKKLLKIFLTINYNSLLIKFAFGVYE